MGRPNRASGSLTSVVIQEEDEWGVAAVTGHVPRGLEFASESLQDTPNNIESQLIRQDRMRSAPQQGNRNPSGDLNLELQPNTVPILLRHALGADIADVATSGSGLFTHEFQGGICLPEGLTVEKNWFFCADDTNLIIRHLGCKVNQFFWGVNQEGVITARAGLISRQELPVDDPLTATPLYIDPNEPFNTFHAAFYLDGELLTVAQSMDMTIDNNIDPNQFAIDGTPNRADIPEGDRAINGNLNVFFTPETYQLYLGSRNNTTYQMRVSFARDDYLIDFLFDAVKLRLQSPQTSAKGPLNLQGTWEAFRSPTLQRDCRVIVRNDEAALSTAA